MEHDVKTYIARISVINQEIKELENDRTTLFAEAKKHGHNVQAIKRILNYQKDPESAASVDIEYNRYLQELGW